MSLKPIAATLSWLSFTGSLLIAAILICAPPVHAQFSSSLERGVMGRSLPTGGSHASARPTPRSRPVFQGTTRTTIARPATYATPSIAPTLHGATNGTIGPPGLSMNSIRAAQAGRAARAGRDASSARAALTGSTATAGGKFHQSNIELITALAFAAAMGVICFLSSRKKANLWMFGASFAVILAVSGVLVGFDQISSPSPVIALPAPAAGCGGF